MVRNYIRFQYLGIVAKIIMNELQSSNGK